MLPTIGSKELVASLPTLLGLRPGDIVVVPELAYPTYEIGALMAGATAVRADSLTRSGPERVSLMWINSPSNPTGRVLPLEHLAKIVVLGPFSRGASSPPTSATSTSDGIDAGVDPASGGLRRRLHTGLLAVHSLSKRSNMAGYRAGFVSGDPGSRGAG